MVRALSKTYTGPLYQVRGGSSAMNTGSGGTLKDIPMLADGFADTAMQDAFCANTICTVSLLYDHSGNGNTLPVAKKGLTNGGANAGMDDFESAANKGMMMIGGHKVYSLYMNAREGYRIMTKGKNVPTGSASQGIYELADGTHVGNAVLLGLRQRHHESPVVRRHEHLVLRHRVLGQGRRLRPVDDGRLRGRRLGRWFQDWRSRLGRAGRRASGEQRTTCR